MLTPTLTNMHTLREEWIAATCRAVYPIICSCFVKFSRSTRTVQGAPSPERRMKKKHKLTMFLSLFRQTYDDKVTVFIHTNLWWQSYRLYSHKPMMTKLTSLFTQTYDDKVTVFIHTNLWWQSYRLYSHKPMMTKLPSFGSLSTSDALTNLEMHTWMNLLWAKQSEYFKCMKRIKNNNSITGLNKYKFIQLH